MQRVRSRDLPVRPGAQGAREGVPPQLLHLLGVQKAAVDGRGTVRVRRQQVHMQGGLLGGKGANAL